jgi:ubiquinone/menaquinone biosynthesis C-methylase UbiE
MKLTQRQTRERQFFNHNANINQEVPVYFDSISHLEDRPWNSYWCIDKLALHHFKGRGENILDLGCGSGENSIKLAKIGYEVHGIDISPNTIKLAKKITHQHGLENKIKFSAGIAEKLNFPNNYFDYVYGVDILHHVEIEPTINEVWRVLKPGGKAFFREHLRVTLLDSIRETKLVRYFFPKEESHEKGITHDERKITLEEIQIIKNIFKNVEIIKFEFISKFYVFFNYNLKVAGELEKIDWRLFRLFPFLNIFGGNGVFILQK